LAVIVSAVILAVAVTGLLVVKSGRAAPETESENGILFGSVTSGESTGAEQQPVVTSTFPSLLKMLSALVFVLISIYVLLFLLKRMMGKRYAGGGRDDLLEILGTLCVAPKKTVSLIRVADKSVLVGITDSQISVLAELDAAQTSNILSALPSQGGPERFTELLKSASHKIRGIKMKKSQLAVDG
jgi:flagellar protein FliO/FliZ